MPRKDQIKGISQKEVQKLIEDVDKLRTKYNEQKNIAKSIQSLSNWSNRVNDDISCLTFFLSRYHPPCEGHFFIK